VGKKVFDASSFENQVVFKWTSYAMTCCYSTPYFPLLGVFRLGSKEIIEWCFVPEALLSVLRGSQGTNHSERMLLSSALPPD